MKIQRFEGKDAEEALHLARLSMGPDAVILQTRAVKPTGLKSLVARPRVEVMAAVDQAPRPVGSRQSAVGREDARRQTPDASPNQTDATHNPSELTSDDWRLASSLPTASEARPAPADWQSELTALHLEVARLRSQIQGEDGRPGKASGEAAGLGEEALGLRPWALGTGSGLRPKASSPNPASSPDPWRLASSITTRTIEMREGTCTAVALVGPTGVGKTTTLAKLAAACTQVEHRRVAFITLDCYRLGAVEQLETYAHLLAVPLRVAYSAQELQELRRTYEEYDLVLIDTVGRSPQNRLQLEEMAALLEAAELQEVHLVMDAGASAAKHESVVHGFLPLQPTHLLLSKLDEAPHIDDALVSALNSGLPLSYLTTGQRVPEDLAPADRTQLHRWLCGDI